MYGFKPGAPDCLKIDFRHSQASCFAIIIGSKANSIAGAHPTNDRQTRHGGFLSLFPSMALTYTVHRPHKSCSSALFCIHTVEQHHCAWASHSRCTSQDSPLSMHFLNIRIDWNEWTDARAPDMRLRELKPDDRTKLVEKLNAARPTWS
jgi:hypothetical protein